MEQLFNVNGLMFWSEREIRMRQIMADHFAAGVRRALLAENPAWQIVQVEAPLLTPHRLLNPNYEPNDVWTQEVYVAGRRVGAPELRLPGEPPNPERERLSLRPETTPGSYTYAQHLFSSHSGYKPPLCVWQVGKSFRRETDQVTKNMRLKEFYQQEFQCVYTADTMNDYHAAIQEPVRQMIGEMLGLPTRIVPSDRLPTYSQITVDVEAWSPEPSAQLISSGTITAIAPLPDGGIEPIPSLPTPPGRWMEVCSISRRTDFPDTVKFTTMKKGVQTVKEKDVLVLEVAIGLDRCVYNWSQWADYRARSRF